MSADIQPSLFDVSQPMTTEMLIACLEAEAETHPIEDYLVLVNGKPLKSVKVSSQRVSLMSWDGAEE